MAGKQRLLRFCGRRRAAANPGQAAGAAMDAAEVEFLAEKELVTIIPNFSLDKIYLIGVRPRPRGGVSGLVRTPPGLRGRDAARPPWVGRDSGPGGPGPGALGQVGARGAGGGALAVGLCPQLDL